MHLSHSLCLCLTLSVYAQICFHSAALSSFQSVRVPLPYPSTTLQLYSSTFVPVLLLLAFLFIRVACLYSFTFEEVRRLSKVRFQLIDAAQPTPPAWLRRRIRAPLIIDLCLHDGREEHGRNVYRSLGVLLPPLWSHQCEQFLKIVGHLRLSTVKQRDSRLK